MMKIMSGKALVTCHTVIDIAEGPLLSSHIPLVKKQQASFSVCHKPVAFNLGQTLVYSDTNRETHTHLF